MSQERHPAVEELLGYFEYEHLPEHLQEISRPYCELAEELVESDDVSGRELTVALRKLLESKDCAVRAALD